VRRAKVTGERVSTTAGAFNPTFQRHRAAYRAAAERIGPGRVLDLGCGTGHSIGELAPRESVGVDLDAASLAGQQRETVVADLRDTGLPPGSFPSVVCVHAIEHVPDPDRVAAEAARVLEPGGVAIIVTPNRLTFARPDEIVDPYHEVEMDQDEFHAAVAGSFAEVEMLGLFGSDRYGQFVAREARTLDRLLALDRLRLRRHVPNRVLRVLYDTALRAARLRRSDGVAAAMTVDDFFVGRAGLDKCLDLIAVCRSPRQDPALDSAP
jgi:SAM-dependent methyltransferase